MLLESTSTKGALGLQHGTNSFPHNINVLGWKPMLFRVSSIDSPSGYR
jgi:hypothetical protein